MGAANSADQQAPKKVIGRPFPPGVSGNPSGQPKGIRELRALARVHTPRCIERLAELMEDDDGKVALGAINQLLDRTYGRPTQPLSGDPDAPPVFGLNVRDLLEDAEFRSALQRRILATPGTPRDPGDPGSVAVQGQVDDSTAPGNAGPKAG